MRPDDRSRDIHGLNAAGTVACNPRDREAALRAEVGDIKIGDAATITCRKCLAALGRERRARADEG